jgi:hypothetical protein
LGVGYNWVDTSWNDLNVKLGKMGWELDCKSVFYLGG